MPGIELKEGMSVETDDGRELGRINRFVLNPQTNEVTHIVVEKGWLLPEDKVVPFDRIRSATDDKVVLNEDVRDFDELPPFEESYYVEAPEGQMDPGTTANYPVLPTGPGYYWYPPHGYLGYPAYGLGTYPPTQTVQNIPEDTVPLKEGTNVMSSDDEHVGDVERLFIETNSNTATHFLISQGTFFKDRKLIPVSWIGSATDDEVRLTVPSRLLEKLPPYES
jgi:uncharacterized protein YrrD